MPVVSLRRLNQSPVRLLKFSWPGPPTPRFPETLREWLTADTLDAWLKQSGGFYTAADDTKPSTLRARLRAMPPVELPGMWPNKVQAVVNIEHSLFNDRPRSLILTKVRSVCLEDRLAAAFPRASAVVPLKFECRW